MFAKSLFTHHFLFKHTLSSHPSSLLPFHITIIQNYTLQNNLLFLNISNIHQLYSFNMYLEEIILDGFKSYATRTVISNFDSKFNAITGLNGSGKSNILDAICFVLGITNLSQVSSFLFFYISFLLYSYFLFIL